MALRYLWVFFRATSKQKRISGAYLLPCLMPQLQQLKQEGSKRSMPRYPCNLHGISATSPARCTSPHPAGTWGRAAPRGLPNEAHSPSSGPHAAGERGRQHPRPRRGRFDPFIPIAAAPGLVGEGERTRGSRGTRPRAGALRSAAGRPHLQLVGELLVHPLVLPAHVLVALQPASRPARTERGAALPSPARRRQSGGHQLCPSRSAVWGLPRRKGRARFLSLGGGGWSRL